MTIDISNELLSEIGPDVLRGDAGLWISSAWLLPPNDELAYITRVSWLAIWSESKLSTFATKLKSAWSADSQLTRRVLHEVTGRLEDTLGSYFSLAEICPFFYLNGRDDDWQRLQLREQRRSRDEQIDQIERIRDSLLLIAGYETAEAVVNVVLNEHPSTQVSPRIVVCDLSLDEQRKLAERLANVQPDLFTRIRIFPGTLFELLRRIYEQCGEDTSGEPTLKVGARTVRLAPLLERERPIDEDFAILTTEDIRPGSPEEDRQAIVEHLVRGGGYPWRAFAHNLHWQREQSRSVIEEANQALRSLRDSRGLSVACLNVAADPGAGLTTMLHEVAFRLASLGYPTLVYRQGINGINYDTIRTFLEYLAPPEAETTPAVLVFDETDFGFDTIPGLRELPQKLARDGRHCLIVRGIASHLAHKDARDGAWREARSLAGRSAKVKEQWYSIPLEARLKPKEQSSLCAWAAKQWPGANGQRLEVAVSSWGADWAGDGEPPPLLLCLFFLLRDEISHVSDLGRHFISQVRWVIESCAQLLGRVGVNHPDPAERVSVSSDQLVVALKILRQRFKPSTTSHAVKFTGLLNIFQATPTHEDIEQIFLLLAALGCLRIAMPRHVLASVTRIPNGRLNTAIAMLERAGVIDTSVLPINQEAGGVRARRAFYTLDDTVRLKHPSYGLLALEWLRSKRGQADHDFLNNTRMLDEFAAQIESGGINDYPIELLRPVLMRLRPSHDEVTFAREICTRLLRFQRVRGSRYHEWLFEKSKADMLLSIFEALPEPVASQSSVILHSRGLTRYKSCSRIRSIEECRNRYQDASRDLDLAFVRAQQEHDGEQPANVITSHGLLYLGWAERERTGEGGKMTLADEYRDLARTYFREGLRLRSDNPYAAYGLAESLVSDCQRVANMPESSEIALSFAGNLAEALNLLDVRPEASFAADWEDLKREAIQLLDSSTAERYIQALKAKHDQLGYALDAMKLLDGHIPKEPTADEAEARKIKDAWQLLDMAPARQGTESPLAALLRYALFTSMQDRLKDPAFAERFRLIGKLEKTMYLEQPLWLFDYAMLALQNGRYKDASEAFKQLRKGRRFIEVPLERSCLLVSIDRQMEPRVVVLRVMSAASDGKGWARVEDPRGFIDLVVFSDASFRAAGSQTHPGALMRARLKIRSSGPAAEPLSPGREGVSGS